MFRAKKKTQNTNTSTYDQLVSMRMMGEPQSGKSSLLLKYAEDVFPESYLSTIGLYFKTQTERLDNQTVKIQVYDQTENQDRFSSIGGGSDLESNKLRARAVLFTFDITDPQALNKVEQLLKNERAFIFNPIKILVATKVDKKTDRAISAQAAEEFAKTHDMAAYIETSAKSGINVTAAFRAVCKLVMQQPVKQFIIIRAEEPGKEIIIKPVSEGTHTSGPKR